MTTALAFFSIMLADFQGIQELGFIAGCGNLLQLVASFTILPAAMTLVERRATGEGKTRLRIARPLPIFSKLYHHPRWILGAALIISVLACLGVSRVSLDYNLLDMQPKGTESVEWESKLTEHSKRSSWFGVTTADSLDEVRRKQQAFKALLEVKKVDSLADLLPEDQERRLQAVLELEPLVGAYYLSFEEPEPLEVQEVREMLEKIQFKLRTDVKWDPQKKPAEMEIATTRAALLELLELLELLDTFKQTDPTVVKEKLTPFQRKLFQDFAEKFQLLKNNSHPPGPIQMENVPDELRQRFVGNDTLVNGSTVQAINLATFTTVIGFGSLLAAKHQGIFSLGLLMTVTLSIG